jgi:hypothetical protein
MTTAWNRPDLGDFEVGALYREALGGFVVEFIGTACVPELDGEDVAVFRFVEGAGCLVATKHDYDNAQTFQLISDEIEDDLNE